MSMESRMILSAFSNTFPFNPSSNPHRILTQIILTSTVAQDVTANKWLIQNLNSNLLCSIALVMSNSLQSHGLQLTWLLCPWDSPGKNTGVSCHALLQGIFLIQRLNLCLLHCRQGLYSLSHLGNRSSQKYSLAASLKLYVIQLGSYCGTMRVKSNESILVTRHWTDFLFFFKQLPSK